MTESTETTTETPGATPPTESTETTELTDADREKLTGVVDKERDAAKAANKRAQQAEARLAEMEAAELKRAVAEEKGLSAEQAAFLTGGDAEEMAASADALLAAFKPPSDLRRRPVETTPRSGALGLTEGAPDVSTIADKVLD